MHTLLSKQNKKLKMLNNREEKLKKNKECIQAYILKLERNKPMLRKQHP